MNKTDLTKALKLSKMLDYEFCLAAVREDGRNLKYIKNPTPEICREAAKVKG